jgi:EAL domain-containing protein (putative c-di-GMP-specific phosphodiesterase class I)
MGAMLENASKAYIELGFSFDLDDFGTGYSSFSLLQKLSVKKLKIDRSFIKEIESNLKNQKLVSGLILIAKQLDLIVVAEGVESGQEAAILKAMRCDVGQGYLYGKPARAI